MGRTLLRCQKCKGDFQSSNWKEPYCPGCRVVVAVPVKLPVVVVTNNPFVTKKSMKQRIVVTKKVGRPKGARLGLCKLCDNPIRSGTYCRVHETARVRAWRESKKKASKNG